ncbi:AraC family transcriptional regulator [Panacagrimonas perspica]|uniref:AraC family transcriptional regulator n=2 Tax=Panacagrimonas perspica TaxID=381431 RepID=A0A4R7P6E0_9GAMM|nr:AraC family transcriptional regulator [Panacagrimonas perspica]
MEHARRREPKFSSHPPHSLTSSSRKARGMDRMMLVTPTRIAYRGLFGTPGVRYFGAWTLYVAINTPFEASIDDGPSRSETFVAVPPYTPHLVSTPDREMAEVLVEAEAVDGCRFHDQFLATPVQRQRVAATIRAGLSRPLSSCPSEDFDLRFFGERLPARDLDSRIARAIERMKDDPAGRLTAEDCAAMTGLSFSRFTHLFSDQTQTTFRRFRAWKRARGLMPLIANPLNLLDVALNAGYADSTHFSHSIRQFYGYTPRDIFAGSRRLAIFSQP